jgi:hypothetical protein
MRCSNSNDGVKAMVRQLLYPTKAEKQHAATFQRIANRHKPGMGQGAASLSPVTFPKQ